MRNLFLAFTALALVFSSCQEDDIEPNEPTSTGSGTNGTGTVEQKTINCYFRFGNQTSWEELDSLTYTHPNGDLVRLLPSELPPSTSYNGDSLITITNTYDVGDTIEAIAYFYHEANGLGQYNGYMQVFITTNGPVDMGYDNLCTATVTCGDTYTVQ